MPKIDLEQYAQERIAAMLSTEPIDESVAEYHLRESYRVAGLTPPATIRWFDSPVPFVNASVHWLTLDGVWARVLNSVRDSVEKSVGARVGDSVELSVWDSVWASVSDSVWDSVGACMLNGVLASVGANTLAPARDSVASYSHQTWLSFYRFFHEMLQENDFIHLSCLNEMVSGYRLGENEAWLVRKPIILARDEQGRLHNDSGMCVQYADGRGIYAWHGTRVTEKVIHDASCFYRS